MEEKGLFRTAIGGFHKTDVLSYIDQITGAWNEERQELTAQAEAERQAAAQQIACAQQAQLALEQAQAKMAQMEAQISAMQEQLAALAPLQQQVEALSQQTQQLTGQLEQSRRTAEKTTEQLTEEREKVHTATKEMMAAEERLATRETELAERTEQLKTAENTLTQYEAVLGQCSVIEDHVDSVVRPFIEEANQSADQTLEDVHAAIAAVLAQLGELQQGIDERRHALQERKAIADQRFSDALSQWLKKAQQSADQAAARTTRFFR